MAQQLSLNLDFKVDASISDFRGVGWVSIIDAVRQMHVGLLQQLYLYGEPDTGKTHLLTAICESFREIGKSTIYLSLKDLLSTDPAVLVSLESIEMIAIDDLDMIQGHKAWQEALFHLINLSNEYGHGFIFASHTPVSMLHFELKDLLSRLSKAPTFQLPTGQDKKDRAMMLYSILQRRNWHFDQRIIDYLLDEGPHRVGAILRILKDIEPLLSHLERAYVPKSIIQQAIKIIDEQTLLYELQGLTTEHQQENFLDF